VASESSLLQAPAREVRAPGGFALFFKVLGFVLRDFFRSVWVLLVLGVLVAAHLLLLNSSPTLSHFFGVQYATVLVAAGVATAGFFSRANRAEMYPILARPVSRFALTGALLLASWLVGVGAYLLSTAAAVIRYGPWFEPNASILGWMDAQTFLYGSLPMLAVAGLGVGLVALLSTFVTSSWLRLLILAFIALLIMSFDSRNFPIDGMRPLLQALPPIMAPVASALRYATEGVRDTTTLVSLGMVGGYALLLIVVVLALSATRETVLE